MYSESRKSFIHPHASELFVGRTYEEEQLHQALDHMRRGQGGLILVSGEMGIGKTTLVQRVRDMTPSDDTLVLAGHCYDLADTLPYAPWRRMFTSAPGDTGLPATGAFLSQPESQAAAGSQHELFETVISRLKLLAEHTRLVLILEDIHWADRASLDLLRHLSHGVREMRLLIIATYRNDSTDQPQLLAGILPSLVRESDALRIDLRRLAHEDVMGLVRTRYELGDHQSRKVADYLYDRAEGNPFFTVELMRDLEDRAILVSDGADVQVRDLDNLPIPAMVHQVIALRLEHLRGDAADLLELASVIGQEVPLDFWRMVSGASEEMIVDAIQQAETFHVAFESTDGRQLRFDHALVREALYRNKPALLRRRQHRMIAETLLQQPDPAPDHLAHHLVLADDQRAAEWLTSAGRQAERLHAPYDAVAFVTRAIDVASRHGVDVPPSAYRIRARAYETLGDFDSAHQDLQAAVTAARRIGDLACEREALSDLGMLWSGKDYKRAGAYYKDALNVARAMGDHTAVAQSLNRIGNWYANTGNLGSAIDLHQQALRTLEYEPDENGLLETHDLLGTTMYLAGDYRHALEHLENSIAEARRIGDRVRLASALTMIPIVGGNLVINFEAGVAASRDPSYWPDCANEGLEISRDIGWKAGESFALTTLGSVMAVRGNLGQGIEVAEQGYSLARTIGHQQWASLAALVLGLIWTELEDPKRAELYLARCRATSDAIGSHYWRALAYTNSGFVQVKLGDSRRAAEFLTPLAATESAGRSNTQRSFQFALAHLRLAEGNPAAALACAESLLALEDESSVVRGVPQVLKIKADALAALGRSSDADTTYRDAEQVAAVLGLDAVRWRILAAHSTFLARHQDENTSDVADQARTLIREIGATILETQVRGRFVTRADERLPERETDGDENPGGFSLSDRELDVLRLTAQGLTNVEIGERLFISPRTVAQHLQSIYGKLGVNSRTAAAAVAYEHGLAQ